MLELFDKFDERKSVAQTDIKHFAENYPDHLNYSSDTLIFLARLSKSLANKKKIQKTLNEEEQSLRCLRRKMRKNPETNVSEEIQEHLSVNSIKLYLSKRRKAATEFLQSQTNLSEPEIEELCTTLALPAQVYRQLNKNYEKKIARRQNHPLPIHRLRALIKTAQNLLLSESRIDIIIGLCILTGRRPWELAANETTLLRPVKIDEHKTAKFFLVFEGQSKTHTTDEFNLADKAYMIPVLAPAQKIIEGFQRLHHEEGRIPPYTGLSNAAFNSRSASPLNHKLKTLMVPHWSHNSFQRKLLNFKSIRSLYAEICDEAFNGGGKLQGAKKSAAFIGQILGHQINTIKAAQAYLQFTFDERDLKRAVVPFPTHLPAPGEKPLYDYEEMYKLAEETT